MLKKFLSELKTGISEFFTGNRRFISNVYGRILLNDKKYIVNLNQKEREYLEAIIGNRKSPSYRIKHARILLNADTGGINKPDKEISLLLRCHRNTVADVCRRFVEYGMESALARKKREADTGIPYKETYLIAAACSEIYPNWGLKMLSNKTIGMDIAGESLRQWSLPSDRNASFVAGMEDVLALYRRPFESSVPVICADEQSVRFIGENDDDEYIRSGKAEVFMFTEPLTGFRKFAVRESKKGADWAHEIRLLLEQDYPTAEKVVLICDKYSAHVIGSLYETFDPVQARSMAEKLEMHYIPKHGTWLNIAEIELGAFIHQCADIKKISDIGALRSETKARTSGRDSGLKTLDWHLSVEIARKIFRCLYPKL